MVKKNTKQIIKKMIIGLYRKIFAPVFEKPPEIDNIHEGQTVHLRCKIQANPQPNVVWVRHGCMLSHNNKYVHSVELAKG